MVIERCRKLLIFDIGRALLNFHFQYLKMTEAYIEKLVAQVKVLRPEQKIVLQIMALSVRPLTSEGVLNIVRKIQGSEFSDFSQISKLAKKEIATIQKEFEKLEWANLKSTWEGHYLRMWTLPTLWEKLFSSPRLFEYLMSAVSQSRNYGYGYGWFGEHMKLLLKALRSSDEKVLVQELKYLKRDANFFEELGSLHPNRLLFGSSLDNILTSPLSAALRMELMGEMVLDAIFDWESTKDFERILGLMASQPDLSLFSQKMLVDVALFRGDIHRAQHLIKEIPSVSEGEGSQWKGVLATLQGEDEEALQHFEEAAKKLKKRGVLSESTLLFHSVCLLLLGKNDLVVQNSHKKSRYQAINQLLASTALFRQNKKTDSIYQWNLGHAAGSKHLMGVFFTFVVGYWNGLFEKGLGDDDRESLLRLLQYALEGDYPFIAINLRVILDETTPHWPRKDYPVLLGEAHLEPFVNRLHIEDAWERTLKGLLLITDPGSQSSAVDTNQRVSWMVDLRTNSIEAKEQKVLKNGSWSKGRKIAVKRLFDPSSEVIFSKKDLQVAKALKIDRPHMYGYESYVWDFGEAIWALADHPHVYSAVQEDLQIKIEKGEPKVILEESKQSYVLKMDPPVTKPGIFWIKETETRYVVYNIDAAQGEVASMIAGGIKFPKKAEAQLKTVLANLSNVMPVQSDAEFAVDLPEVEADSTPVMQLLQLGEEFAADLYVKPFGSEPPYLKLGEGKDLLIGEVEGKRVQTRRDMAAEKRGKKHVMDQCPVLARVPSANMEWRMGDPEEMLELMLELDPLVREKKVIVEWPKGQVLKLAGTRHDFGDLSMRVARKADWFEVSGEMKVDEDTVLELSHLLTLLHNHQGKNFLQLDDGRFLALTQKLRAQLDQLQGVMNQGRKGDGIHHLNASVLEEMEEMGLSLQKDKAWREQVKKLAESRKFQPVLPQDLQADLRPYQLEGFQWLSRLAHWGVGACLADDMGLGKTVQALALLLSRAKLGPAMVVAPASVTRNWLREAQKFAPNLNPILLHEGNRADTIASLGPYDLLITSYALVHIEQEGLSSLEFSTLILDEAQAIKNRQTKRSQAVKTIKASFKMVTTGTPVENHLGELWNLFDFLNPGFLGSWERFNNTYAQPIEKFENVLKKHQLRNVLKPFILRRRKSEVLRELPDKTEIVLHLELSKEELAFYEAIRREALSRLQGKVGNPGEQRLRILAEITRLRQAACNPSLLRPELGLESSKLNLFGEVVRELRENGHKALVFSQFVKHLALVREWVDKEGIPYQYLDGSTPLKQREERVNAFQQGNGDLFLISLKAGGVGLNLTAADYVIHLDPWWNPAVEDQASDRAHRIGQQKPVTVYRLVAEQTIEEKILSLHDTKRQLAESLLEGTESGGKLSSDELLDLIRESV